MHEDQPKTKTSCRTGQPQTGVGVGVVVGVGVGVVVGVGVGVVVEVTREPTFGDSWTVSTAGVGASAAIAVGASANYAILGSGAATTDPVLALIEGLEHIWREGLCNQAARVAPSWPSRISPARWPAFTLKMVADEPGAIFGFLDEHRGGRIDTPQRLPRPAGTTS